MAHRIRIVSALFMIGCLALVGRLFYWQIIQNTDLSQAASTQQTNRQRIYAKRGVIYASDDSILAGIATSWRLALYRPELKSEENEVSKKLSQILAQDPQDELSIASQSARINSLLSQNKSYWIPLANSVTREQKKNIEESDLSGLIFEESIIRSYPEASMSAHLLGFLGKDENAKDKGYFGLEGFYDLLLSGKSGVYETKSNALGVSLISDDDVRLNSFQGADLHTSIDKTMQLIAEKNLEAALSKYESQAGSVTVINPKNGEILAMVSFPSYNPSKYTEWTDLEFRNPVISDAFEPGSIMKPIVMAAGFDSGVIDEASICDICDKPYTVGPYVIRTWNNQYRANSTMAEIIKNSDNVGMVFIGKKLGTQKLYDYLDRFGFGKYTEVDLQGEYEAPLRKISEWGEVERDTASFGQGIAVTPLQMIKAIAILANNGSEVSPHVVRSIELADWKNIKSYPSSKQVVSPKAAQAVTKIMVNAVDNGEAKWAIPKDYVGMIAGKTGTAQIAVGGSYDEEKTNASFVGFAPANDPKFAMMITLKEPKTSPWASETAAPLWFKIAGEYLRYLGVAPNR